jgi:hypothetical protein
MERVQSSFGHQATAVVMTTAVTVTDTPTVYTHCLSARRRITGSHRGTPKHVRQHSLRPSAADQEESKKL